MAQVYHWHFGYEGSGNTTSARWLSGLNIRELAVDAARAVVPFDGTIARLRVRFAGPATATASITFTVQVGGVDTALVLVIAQGQTSGEASGSIAVTAGQLVSIKSVASAAEADAVLARATLSAEI